MGEHLKRRRLDLGKVQKEVAREIGVSHQTYGYWEVGRTVPELRHFPGIVRFLGYDPAPADPTLSIGEQLRIKRRREGLSQEELARRLGIDPTTIAKWERRGEQGRPAGKVLRAILTFLSA